MATDNSQPSENNKGQRENFLGISLICLFIFLTWIITWVGLSAYYENDPEGKGTFGDMFGSINALYSGLGLAGIVYTIILQRRDLHMQRDELKSTRNEIVQQNETMEKQRFENTFFQLVTLLHEIINSLHHSRILNSKRQSIEKREVFRVGYSDLVSSINVRRSTTSIDNMGNYIQTPKTNITVSDEYTYLLEGYITFYETYADTLGHYFRHLYHIFKYIFNSNLKDEEKKFYASLVRAQLSQSELSLIFYNSLIYGLGSPKFLFLIKEFDILQNFNYSALAQSIHKNIFANHLTEAKNPFNDSPTQFAP